MTRQIGILVSGSEILDGRVLDTNSHLITERLTDLGYKIRHSVSCGDTFEDLENSLNFLLTRVDGVVLSGGMGPTGDDLTRDFLAQRAGVVLVQNMQALEELRALYERRKRVFDPTNSKQTFFPEGAEIIRNPVGTAPGFMIQLQSGNHVVPVFALPGVPVELERMLIDGVIPLLSKCFGPPLGIAQRRAMKIFGLPESVIGERVASSNPPSDLIVSYRATFPEVHVVLKSPSLDYPRERLNEAFEAAKARIGTEFIFAEDLRISFEQSVHTLLTDGRKTVAVAESCTGGLLGSLLTNLPGSSAYFKGGILSYSNEVKETLLHVAKAALEQHGAVSYQVACAMASGARDAVRADYAISITGIAGPDGGTEEKPVGTFFVGIADARCTTSYHCFLSGSRSRVRRYAAFTALDILRRKLLGLPIPFTSYVAD